jgi:hypothetical protein
VLEQLTPVLWKTPDAHVSNTNNNNGRCGLAIPFLLSKPNGGYKAIAPKKLVLRKTGGAQGRWWCGARCGEPEQAERKNERKKTKDKGRAASVHARFTRFAQVTQLQRGHMERAG